VLVPAHDEELLVGRCVESLLEQTYPRELYEVVVIADNCTDQTAARAEAAGAEVLVRDEPDVRGKGQALRWALDRLLTRAEPPDAVVVVDADTVAVPEFLELLTRPLDDGAEAVQGESLLFDDESPLRAAAFLLVNRTRPSGKDVLGLPCTLQGNGMLVATRVLRARPWDAFTAAEDLEYTIALRLDGLRARYAGGATLHSPAAPTRASAVHQQLRWEGGKVHVARTQVPRLVSEALRRRDWSLLETALDLAVPPLGLLAALEAAGTAATAIGAAAGAVPLWALVPWAVGDVAVPLYVLIGLRAARAPRSAYRALLHAPVLVARKVAALPRLAGFRADTWVRTEREPGSGP
jgi:1,2-diacylglycerol 3-beta-glucosyltransferase